jgi:sugar phosphate isomerase/epimerase
MISLSSDFLSDKGDPEAHLELIAEAGFKRVHWVHHWNDDFYYTPSEIAQLRQWLSDFGLGLHGIHGSAGVEKCWFSPLERQRKAGVELVMNRVEMAAKLSAGFVVMHVPMLADDFKEQWRQLLKSVDELKPEVQRLGVRLAIENMCNDDFAGLDILLERYPADYLGLCYDAGHGNVGRRDGLQHVERRARRVVALHVHDNNTFNDQHKLPFASALDWAAFAKTIAKTPAHDKINLEVIDKGSCEHKAPEFLKAAFEAASKIEAMVAEERGKLSEES